MYRLIVIAVALLSIVLSGATPVRAQDATPSGSPAADECFAPPLPSGTPTPIDEMGSPVGEELAGASPAAPATPDPDEGAPANQDTVERVISAELNLFACFNQGDVLAAAALYTPEALEANFGLSNPYDLPNLMAGVPDVELIEIRDVRVLDDGRIRFEDFYTDGEFLYHDLNYLVEQGGFLLVAETISLSADPVTDTTPTA